MYQTLIGIACEGEAEAYVFKNCNTITRTDIHGTLRNTVSTKRLIRPETISTTKERELIYSGNANATVNILRQGNSITVTTTTQNWTLGALSWENPCTLA